MSKNTSQRSLSTTSTSAPDARTRALVQEGYALCSQALQKMVDELGSDITEACPLLVHATARQRWTHLKSEFQELGDGWSVTAITKPTHIPSAPQELLPADGVVCLVAVGKHTVMRVLPPEQILPPSNIGPLESDKDGGYTLDLQQSLFVFFHSDQEDLQPGLARERHRRFVARVRAEVLAELARSGSKRSLLEIINRLLEGARSSQVHTSNTTLDVTMLPQIVEQIAGLAN